MLIYRNAEEVHGLRKFGNPSLVQLTFVIQRCCETVHIFQRCCETVYIFAQRKP